MKTNGNESIHREPKDDVQFNSQTFGLTKREYFAVMAMQGLSVAAIPGGHNMTSEVVRDAVQRADALIAELNKDPEVKFYTCGNCSGRGVVKSMNFGSVKCDACQGKGKVSEVRP